MAPSFDPYHKWLGIPSDEQPPSHYRLLGIRELESDPEVIQSAADQRMAHLRTYQTSRHADWSQRLLNEVATAKICLLTPAKKTAYDRKMSAEGQGGKTWRAAPRRTELFPASSARPGPFPEPAGTVAGNLGTPSMESCLHGETVQPLPPGIAIQGRFPRSAINARLNKGRLPLAAFIVVLVMAVFAGLTHWRRESRETPAVVAKLHGPPASRERTSDAELRTAPKPRKTSPAGKPVSESRPADRVVLPPAAAQEEAMSLTRDLYQADLAKAKTAAKKQALASTLLAEAKAAKSTDVSTLVLLRLARDTAVQACDVVTAFAAIDAMAAQYRIDPREMKPATLSACAKTARTQAQHHVLAKQAERMRDELAATGASAQAAAMAKLAATERDAAGSANP